MDIYYKNNYGKSISLSSWPIVIQDPESLFANKWGYTSQSSQKTGGKITSFYKSVSEKSFSVSIFADSEGDFNQVMEEMSQVFEMDMVNLTPGKLYANDYYIKGYIFSSEYSNYEEDFYAVDKKMTLVSGYPLWIKEETFTFTAGSVISTGQNLDFPFDFPYDFKSSNVGKKIANTSLTPSNVKIIIYGGVTNPEIIIDGHVYGITATIETGEYLTIDTIDKKIIKTKINGETENLFDARNRDSYIFEKVPAGNNSVAWSGTFTFEVIVYDERSEPKWI